MSKDDSEEKKETAAESVNPAEDTVQNQSEEAAAAASEEASAEEKSELDVAKDTIASLQKQVEELTKEKADLNDKVLRRAAEFDNYRKRMMQEKQDAFDYANTNLLKDLLDSLDNFDRTVEAAATATDPKAIAEGVTMINKSMVSMLENKYNLAAYGQAGDAFDPDLHEAIGSSNDPVAEPVLKAVYLKGYKLKDRVIRHAKVMVSMPDGTVQSQQADAQDSASAETESK